LLEGSTKVGSRSVATFGGLQRGENGRRRGGRKFFAVFRKKFKKPLKFPKTLPLPDLDTAQSQSGTLV
jgi:hypothetical protein